MRSDTNDSRTYLLATYSENSKTDITLFDSGPGGIEAACQNLPNDKPIFGGVRLSTGRFVSFLYTGDEVGIMLKGRASMHKNGVFNVLQGCDAEIEVWKNMPEEHVGKSFEKKDTMAPMMSSVERERLSTQSAQQQDKDVSVTQPVDIPRQSDITSSSFTTNADQHERRHNDKQIFGFIPYERLKNVTDSSSLGIDPRQKELALSDAEFEQIFQMSKESFASLANWKKTQLKKAALLF